MSSGLVKCIVWKFNLEAASMFSILSSINTVYSGIKLNLLEARLNILGSGLISFSSPDIIKPSNKFKKENFSFVYKKVSADQFERT